MAGGDGGNHHDEDAGERKRMSLTVGGVLLSKIYCYIMIIIIGVFSKPEYYCKEEEKRK